MEKQYQINAQLLGPTCKYAKEVKILNCMVVTNCRLCVSEVEGVCDRKVGASLVIQGQVVAEFAGTPGKVNPADLDIRHFELTLRNGSINMVIEEEECDIAILQGHLVTHVDAKNMSQ